SFETNLHYLKQKLIEKKDTLISILSEELSNHLTFQIPEGGIHLWCQLGSEINEFQLLEEALRNGVAFVPGSLLGSKNGYIRLTYGRVESNLIREGILRLKKSILKLTNSPSSFSQK
ncbi:MAG: PLP-dependent aminotransferase family protein, partial [Bacillus sp. (in: firmicutes)]|nr:PLP-dependent aminotransferase family protein [Bacillus sp. (in: firmicutes)]